MSEVRVCCAFRAVHESDCTWSFVQKLRNVDFYYAEAHMKFFVFYQVIKM